MNKNTSRVIILSLLVISIAWVYSMVKETKKCNTMNVPEQNISDKTLELLKNMRNDDVMWIGDFAGIHPQKPTGTILSLLDVQEDINPLLINALLDEDKFVAAHVLLIWRTSRTNNSGYYIVAHNGAWNGLKVKMIGKGPLVEGNDLNQLHYYWCKKLQ